MSTEILALNRPQFAMWEMTSHSLIGYSARGPGNGQHTGLGNNAMKSLRATAQSEIINLGTHGRCFEVCYFLGYSHFECGYQKKFSNCEMATFDVFQFDYRN